MASGAPAGAVGLLLAVRNCGDGGCYGNPGATLVVQNRDRTLDLVGTRRYPGKGFSGACGNPLCLF